MSEIVVEKTEKNVEIKITESDKSLAREIATTVGKMVEDAVAQGKNTPQSSSLFSAAMSGVQSERHRVLQLLIDLGKEAALAMHRASGLVIAARLAGDESEARVIEGEKSAHAVVARVLMSAIDEVARDPAACPACKGKKTVPSRLALSGAAEVPCQLCSSPAMPTIDGFVAQCERCDEAAEPTDPAEYRPEPWRAGLCVACKAAA